MVERLGEEGGRRWLGKRREVKGRVGGKRGDGGLGEERDGGTW